MKTDVINGNKLIAEFMGAVILKRGQLAYDMEDGFPNGADRLMPEKMLYHSSHEWLMPVIDKILGMDEYINEYVLITDYFDLNNWKDVIEFIQWFNRKNINK